MKTSLRDLDRGCLLEKEDLQVCLCFSKPAPGFVFLQSDDFQKTSWSSRSSRFSLSRSSSEKGFRSAAARTAASSSASPRSQEFTPTSSWPTRTSSSRSEHLSMLTQVVKIVLHSRPLLRNKWKMKQLSLTDQTWKRFEILGSIYRPVGDGLKMWPIV